MSAPPANEPAEDTTVGAEVTGTVADSMEEHGRETEAPRAIEHDFSFLLADADQSVSQGYLWSLFSQGARPVQERVS